MQKKKKRAAGRTVCVCVCLCECVCIPRLHRVSLHRRNVTMAVWRLPVTACRLWGLRCCHLELHEFVLLATAATRAAPRPLPSSDSISSN